MPESQHASRDLGSAAVAAVILGAFSTLGDWIWARYIPDGAVLPGVLHGVMIFAILALILGWAAGSLKAMKRLQLTLPIAGLLIAAAFYPLAYVLGYLGALLATWLGMWLSLALLQRWARRNGETTTRALMRGVLAAIGSGLAFWAISGIWTNPAGHTSYLLRFVYWSFAFLPGFVALFWAQPSATASTLERPSPSAGPTW